MKELIWFFNEEHSWKAFVPISVIDEGIEILNKDEQFLKDPLLIFFFLTDNGIITSVYFVHLLKALYSISVTKEGIIILVKDEYLPKVHVFILVIDDEIIKFFNAK